MNAALLERQCEHLAGIRDSIADLRVQEGDASQVIIGLMATAGLKRFEFSDGRYATVSQSESLTVEDVDAFITLCREHGIDPAPALVKTVDYKQAVALLGEALTPLVHQKLSKPAVKISGGTREKKAAAKKPAKAVGR